MRFSYFYWMENKPELIREIAPDHAAYWKGLGLDRYAGGPFADRSGGLITFETDTVDDAARLIAGDPFVRDGLLQDHWIKEWVVEPRI